MLGASIDNETVYIRAGGQALRVPCSYVGAGWEQRIHQRRLFTAQCIKNLKLYLGGLVQMER